MYVALIIVIRFLQKVKTFLKFRNDVVFCLFLDVIFITDILCLLKIDKIFYYK